MSPEQLRGEPLGPASDLLRGGRRALPGADRAACRSPRTRREACSRRGHAAGRRRRPAARGSRAASTRPSRRRCGRSRRNGFAPRGPWRPRSRPRWRRRSDGPTRPRWLRRAATPDAGYVPPLVLPAAAARATERREPAPRAVHVVAAGRWARGSRRVGDRGRAGRSSSSSSTRGAGGPAVAPGEPSATCERPNRAGGKRERPEHDRDERGAGPRQAARQAHLDWTIRFDDGRERSAGHLRPGAGRGHAGGRRQPHSSCTPIASGTEPPGASILERPAPRQGVRPAGCSTTTNRRSLDAPARRIGRSGHRPGRCARRPDLQGGPRDARGPRGARCGLRRRDQPRDRVGRVQHHRAPQRAGRRWRSRRR